MKKAILKFAVIAMMSLVGLSTATPSLSAAQSTSTQEQQASTALDINSATSVQLESLPGIGPAKAAAIVSHRERRPFRRIEDIMRVRGIGRATFRNIKSQIRVATSK